LKKNLLILILIGILVVALYQDKQTKNENVFDFPKVDDIKSAEIDIGGPSGLRAEIKNQLTLI
jgi:AICAR transformylase/IMP cyclohydrolase PurH